ncbi:MAG: penicillin-binding protein 2 [Pseudomonadota bacterium]
MTSEASASRGNGRRLRVQPTAYLISENGPAEAPSDTVFVRARSARAAKTDRSARRIAMCVVVFAFVFAALAMRMATISFGAVEPSRVAAGETGRALPQYEIVDRNGALLATDLPMIALEVWGRDVWDARETANALAAVLPEIDAIELTTKLARGEYVEVRADLSPADRQTIFALGLPGVRFASRSKRFYPQGDLAAHIIGHGEPGKGGVMGLEKAASDGRLAPGPDGTVRSYLDMRVQQALEAELAAGLEEYSATAAWGGVIDVDTGEVIALASLPDFDPNTPGAAEADFRRNRAVYDRYELGSAFKAITAAAAIDAGVAKEGSTYDARGTLKVADRRISDFHGENRVLTLSEVIQHSSNIGIVQIAQALGVDAQKAYLKKLGLFEPLPIPLAERRSPQLPDKWGPVESATVSYGHGISVTPLHLLAAYAAVVNGGYWRSPVFAEGEPQKETRVFSRKTSAIMRRVLRRVIADGTAGFAEASGLYPIGKTATADKPAAGGYNRRSRISSFVGAVPGYAPRYAILISYDEPQPTADSFGYATAGWNAAPTFSRFMDRAAPLLGLRTVSEAEALAGFVSGDFDGEREARGVAESLVR